MRQKTFYRYNPASDQYERVYPSQKTKIITVLRQFAWGVAAAVIVFIIAYNAIDFPREKELRQKNERLADEVKMLTRRADELTAVMEDIADRDNNFYRVLLQSDPISDARRYAGLERQKSIERLDSLGDERMVAELDDKLDRLAQLVYSQSKSFDFLGKEASTLKDRILHIPAIMPLAEKNLRAVASGYGYRSDPIYGTSKFHEGMDFSAHPGTPVYATGNGTVLSAKYDGAYGNSVEVNHGYNYLTRYAHLQDMYVKPGQTVKRGDLIGTVGSTGKATGPHLHYEVRLRNVPQNPVHYYFMDQTPEEYDEMIRRAENAGRVMD